MQRMLIIALVLFCSCSSYQGLSIYGEVVEIQEKKGLVLISFPCVNNKKFTKPCFGADYFEISQFDSLYLGKKIVLK